MARFCRWCGAFIEDKQELQEHEQIHRDLDFLDGNVNADEKVRSLDLAGEEVNVNRDLEVDLPVPLRSTRYKCDQCSRTYQYKKHINALVRSEHEGVTYTCTKCKTSFKKNSDKTRHEKTCAGSEHVCPKCEKRCASAYGLRRHLQWHDKLPVKKITPSSSSSASLTATATKVRPTIEARPPSHQTHYICRCCSESFEKRHDLYLHGMRAHYDQSGGALQQQPYGPNELPPWQDDDALRRVYEANAPIILKKRMV